MPVLRALRHAATHELSNHVRHAQQFLKHAAAARQVWAALLCVMALGWPLASQAQNFVYVNNGTAPANSISAFAVDTAGLLTAVPGSPFSTGGAGGTVLCSAVDRITVNGAKSLLFVSNSGDQTISVFQIAPATGALTPVAGSPLASGLTLDSCAGISLAATPNGNFLMASSNGSIKTFSVAASGALSLVSTVSGLPTPMVGMKISGDNRLLAISHESSVSVFTIGIDGSLTAVAGSPFLKSGTGLLGGVEFSCNGSLLYAGEGASATSITEAWTVAPTGVLSPILGSPFAATGTDSNIVFLTPDNTLLFQSNQGSNDLNSFAVNADGTLTSIGIFGGVGSTHLPAGLASDNSGNFLYAADDAFGLAVFNILPGVVPALIGDTAITGAGQIQGVTAYPPRSCAQTDFAITQTATPNPVTAGNNVTYTITVTNNGPSAASVAINDLLPRNSVTFVSCAVTANGTCDKGNGLNRTVTFANLLSGQSGTVTLVVKSVATLLNGDTISNTSVVSNSSAVDPNPVDNTATTSVTVSAPLAASTLTVPGVADLYSTPVAVSATLKRTLNGAAVPGQTITFTANGLALGTAITDAAGVATIPSAVPTAIPVGSYPTGISASFAGNTQYFASSGTGSLTINKATLTVVASATRFYGDANPAFTITFTGFQNNETAAVVSGAPTCTTTATTTSAPGPYPITCTIGTLTAQNYAFTFVTGVLTVNPAPLVLAATDASRLYGDPNPAFTGTITGLKLGQTATATFASAASAGSPVGAYPIIGTVVPGTGFVATNYAITSTGTLTVNPAPLSAIADNATRVYGDPNPAFTGTFTGVKNGDQITATFASVADPTSPVGTYPITATLTATSLANYVVTTNGGTLTITPAALTVGAANAARLYGDANPVLSGTLSGLKNADNITATYASTAAAASVVGAYAIVPALVDPTGKLANYAVTSTNGTLTVNPAPLSVVAASLSRAYGDPNPTLTGTITGVKNTDNITATYSSTATATSIVGPYSIVPTVLAQAATLANYTLTTTNGTLTVSPAPLTVAANDASRLYGDPNPVFSGTFTGLKNGDNVTATFSTAATTASTAGTYAIVPTLVDPTGKLSNYTVNSTNGTLTVSPAALTVTGANASRIYGDPNPAFTGTLTGLKNGDNITASFGTAATAASAVGTYPIVPGLVDPTGKLGNYTVTSNNGTLTVTPAALTVAANNASRLYGDANPVFTGTIVGLKNGDNITATASGVGADPTSPVGTYVLIPALVDPTGKLGNYTVASTNGTLTVTQAPLAVAAANTTRLYGNANPVFTGTIIGIKNADNITATYASTAAAASVVGTYAIVPSLADPTAKLVNYSVTSTNGALTVSPAPLSVTAANATRLYGDPNPVFTGAITGLKNADNITATYASTATATSAVGTFAIVPTLVDPTAKLSNYSVTSTNGTLTVDAAPLTVTATNASRVYGAANPAFTGTVTGLRNGDNITATFASAATALSSAGTYPILPTLVDATAKLGNYAVISNNGTLTVTQAVLIISADAKIMTYGGAVPVLTFTPTGFLNGDTATVLSGSPALATTATSASPVGTYPISGAPGTLSAVNYTFSFVSGVMTVNKALLTVTADAKSMPYGGPVPALTFSGAGFVNGDTAAVLTGSPALTTTATSTSAIGSYPITTAAGTLAAANYNFSFTNGTLTVNKAVLNITADAKSMTYAGTVPALTFTASGFVNGDTSAVLTGSPALSTTATAASAAGTYPITGAVGTLSAANYSFSFVNGTLTVNKAVLTITADAKSMTYGGTVPALTFTPAGFVNGDTSAVLTGSPALTSAASSASAVGTYPISGAAGTLAAANYSFTFVNGTMTVNKAPLTITADAKSMTYGATVPALTFSGTGFVNGDTAAVLTGSPALATTATSTAAIGSYPITAALGTLAAANYSFSFVDGTLTIGKAPLTITADAKSMTYGGTVPALTFTASGFVNGDTAAVLTGTPALTTTATTASAAGSYPIAAAIGTLATTNNYTFTLVNGTLTVNKAPLTITANNSSRAYGAVDPVFTTVVTGFVNGDTAAVLAGTLSCTSAATSASSVAGGPYPINCSGQTAANYAISFPPGQLTITPVPLTVTANNASRAYGAADPAFTATYGGFVNGESATVLTGALACTTAATAASPVGSGPFAINCSGQSSSNYAISFAPGQLTITAAPLTITANSLTRNYGAADPVFTAAYNGLVNGETPAALAGVLSCSSLATTASPVGPYAITCSGQAATNYAITYAPGVLTVAPAPLTVSGSNGSRAYGAANPALTGTITGVVNNDVINAAFTTAADAASAVGSYPVVPNATGAALSNYAVNIVNGALNVTPAPLTVTAANASRPFGSANPAFTGTVTGLVNNDNITATFGTAASASSAAGTYAIVPTLVDPAGKLGNYAVTSNNGTLAITQLGTSMSLAASLASLLPNTPVTFTATVAEPSATGIVTFSEAGTTLGTGQLNSSGVASFTTSALVVGAHSVVASYSGDTNFTASTAAAVALVVNPFPAPGLGGVSPAVIKAGSGAFTLTINGSNFMPGAVVRWNGSDRATTLVNTAQVTASISAADIASAGTADVLVVNPAPGGGPTSAFKVVIDSAASASGAFSVSATNTTLNVTQGQNTTMQVTLGTSASAQITATCLNLPAGATCAYDNNTKTVTITTSASTPKGSYEIVVVFSATQQVASAAVHSTTFLAAWFGMSGLPVGFLWFAGFRNKERRRRTILGLVLGLMLILWLAGCGGGASTQPPSNPAPTPTPTTTTTQSSITATLVVN